MLFIKIHKSYRTLVAICDSKILGKEFEEKLQNSPDTKCLNIRESFYKGEPISYEKALETLRFQAKEDATFNIAGPNAIKAAKEANIITDEGIGHVDGIPYALVLL